MNNLIKERLEKIEEGIVPGGYKRTKVGIIPGDWEVAFLESLCNITTGNKDTQDKQDEAIYDFFVRSNTIEKIDSYSYDGEAILTAGDGVGTGKVFHYINDKFDYHQRVYCLNQFKNMNGKYLYYYFSENFIRQVYKYSAKTSVDSVRREMLTKMIIPTPPLEEQVEIANILSTWDKAIENIEKLIKEKEIQKKGLMQELLTGKTRLPGFNGEREEVKLGEIANVFDGVHQTPKYTEDGVPFVSVENIRDIYSTEKYVSEEFYLKNYVNSKKEIEIGNILMTRIGSIGVPYLIEEKTRFAYYVTLALIKIKDETINPKFLYYVIQSGFFQRELYKKTLHVAYPNKINLGEINLVKFIYPSLPEQKAIAEILSTADKEIELLNQLLENKKEEKKGLMQLLLTGIVRV